MKNGQSAEIGAVRTELNVFEGHGEIFMYNKMIKIRLFEFVPTLTQTTGIVPLEKEKRSPCACTRPETRSVILGRKTYSLRRFGHLSLPQRIITQMMWFYIYGCKNKIDRGK